MSLHYCPLKTLTKSLPTVKLIPHHLQVAKARSKSRKLKATEGAVDQSSSDETSSATPERPKRTRSKMKTNKAAPPTLPVEGSDTEEGPKSTESEEDGTFKTPEPVKKPARSKLRKAKVCSRSFPVNCLFELKMYFQYNE